MRQQPGGDSAPLDPPSSETAQAYLDVVPGLVIRRESLIDDWRLGRLTIIEGVALSAYVGVLMAVAGAGDVSRPIVLVMLPFLAWMQLSAGLRERFGVRRRAPARQGVLNTVLLVVTMLAMLVVLVLAVAQMRIPFIVRMLPPAVLLLAAVLTGARQMRAGGNREPCAAPAHAAFSSGVSWTTVGVGVVLGGVTAMTSLMWRPGIGSALAWLAATIAMILLIVASATRTLRELGAAWRPPQWIAFAIAAIAMLVVLLTGPAMPIVPVSLGIAVAAMFLAASLRPVADDG